MKNDTSGFQRGGDASGGLGSVALDMSMSPGDAPTANDSGRPGACARNHERDAANHSDHAQYAGEGQSPLAVRGCVDGTDVQHGLSTRVRDALIDERQNACHDQDDAKGGCR